MVSVLFPEIKNSLKLNLMHAFFSSCFQIDCWFHLVCCICCFVKLGSFLHKWMWLSFYKCRSRKIQDYLAINSTGVFQKAVAYMKICCIYAKQYTRSYIVRYRFLIFLNRIFSHLPFTSMLAKRSFLCLFRTQKDNTEKLFSLLLVSLVKFVTYGV